MHFILIHLLKFWIIADIFTAHADNFLYCKYKLFSFRLCWSSIPCVSTLYYIILSPCLSPKNNKTKIVEWNFTQLSSAKKRDPHKFKKVTSAQIRLQHTNICDFSPLLVSFKEHASRSFWWIAFLCLSPSWKFLFG